MQNSTLRPPPTTPSSPCRCTVKLCEAACKLGGSSFVASVVGEVFGSLEAFLIVHRSVRWTASSYCLLDLTTVLSLFLPTLRFSLVVYLLACLSVCLSVPFAQTSASTAFSECGVHLGGRPNSNDPHLHNGNLAKHSPG